MLDRVAQSDELDMLKASQITKNKYQVLYTQDSKKTKQRQKAILQWKSRRMDAFDGRTDGQVNGWMRDRWMDGLSRTDG